jgi:MFS family permease
MQQAALLWHVSLLVPDHKGLALGLVGLVRVVPIIAFSLVSGVAADTFDRRKLMLITQIGGATVAAVLAVLAFRGLTAVWPIYALAAVSASVGAFDPPARHALVPMLVPREHLPNAISLNTVMIQAASVAGPAIGGVIIAVGNVGWAYAINSASFLCVVASLIMMRDVPGRGAAGDGARDMSIRRSGRHPLRLHASGHRSTMLLDFFATFFSSATARCCRSSRRTCVSDRAATDGCARRRPSGHIAAPPWCRSRTDRRGQTLLWAVMVYGLATVVFGFSRSFWLTLACLAVSGAADASMIIRNIVRQLETSDACGDGWWAST